MSKYEALWIYVKNNCGATLILTYDEIEEILGFKIDHSFLNFKKELLDFGFEVNKISLKDKTVLFKRMD